MEAEVDAVNFASAVACDFSKASGALSRFEDVRRSKFRGAVLKQCDFQQGDFSEADFTHAAMDCALFSESGQYGSGRKFSVAGVSFAKANLKSARFFDSAILVAPL